MLRPVFGFFIAAALGNPVSAQPATWLVDPAKSSVQFAVAISGQTITGTFKAFGAAIAFDPADLAHSSAKITIDMTEAKSGNATRDAMLLKPDWFNVLDFPQAVFQTTGFAAKGADAYEARGTLTMKGVRKEILLPFTLKIVGDVATMKGWTVLRRTDFKVGRGEDFEGETPVATSVKVMVNLTAKRRK